jgi:hypothetical protein
VWKTVSTPSKAAENNSSCDGVQEVSVTGLGSLQLIQAFDQDLVVLFVSRYIYVSNYQDWALK